jgi:hypothetical protein
MPTWKKVIVSGSQAHLAAVTASVGVLVGTNQQITTNPSTTFLSGSFSGSFQGSISATITTAVTASVTSVTDTQTGAGPYYITFKDAVTGHPLDRVDSTGLRYNADSNAVTASIFFSSQSSGVGFVGTASVALTASNITPAITAGNTNNNVLTANGNGTLTGESNLTFDSSILTITGDIAVNGATSADITTTTTTATVFNTTATTVNIAGAGTTISIGAGTGNTTVNNNLTVTGDLTVNGTTTTINTNNLLVEDKFILLASGSTTAATAVGGIVVQNAANSTGSAFIWKGADNRWAVVPAVGSTDADATVNSYLVTVSGSSVDPGGNPLYGAADASRIGAMYVNTSTQDIWIWS